MNATFLSASLVHATDIAKVNGRELTDYDLQVAANNFNTSQRQNVLKDSNSRRQVLSNLIQMELLMQEAEKEKLDSDQEYNRALRVFRRQFLANRVLEKKLEPKFSDSAAKQYYADHKSRFSTEMVHSLYILVRDERKAGEIYSKAKGLSDGDFKDLAEKVSEDPTVKTNSGDMQWLGRDRMTPKFAEIMFSAKKGDVIGPLKTNIGYQIIKIVGKEADKALDYDSVAVRVKNDLRHDLAQVYVDQLMNQAKVEVDDKAVQQAQY